MKTFKVYIIGLLMIFSLAACTKMNAKSEFHNTATLGLKDTLVIMTDLRVITNFDDKDIEDCIRPIINNANPSIQFISAKHFRENLYPYFMPNTTPRSMLDYINIMNGSIVQQRINALKVRYLIMMTNGGTRSQDISGIFCGSIGAGGGCLGLGLWGRKSELELVIWDLQSGSYVGTMRADAAGTNVMPAVVFPIPIYLPATESKICKELGVRLSNWLSGQQ